MAQIINPQPTWQEALGSGLGKGIQTGVTSLIEQKLQQMGEERQMSQRGKAIEGLAKSGFLGKDVTPESLEALKYLDPTTLNTILKEQLRAPQNAAFAKYLGGIAGGEEGTEIPQGLTGQQAYQATKIKLQKQATEQAAAQKGIDITKDYREKLQQDVKADDVREAKLNRLENIIKTQNVAQGLKSKLPSFLQNKETQEAEGLINDILIPLEGRANTDAKLRAIMDSFARLGDTKEAKLSKIKMAKELSKLSKIESKAANQIVKEKGYPPFNLPDLAWERSTPEREKIYANIEKGIGGESAQIVPGQSAAKVDKKAIPVGQILVHPKTGKRYIWNGTEAVPEGEK